MTSNEMRQKLSPLVKDPSELGKFVDVGILNRTAGIQGIQLYSTRGDYDKDYGKLTLIN